MRHFFSAVGALKFPTAGNMRSRQKVAESPLQTQQWALLECATLCTKVNDKCTKGNRQFVGMINRKTGRYKQK